MITLTLYLPAEKRFETLQRLERISNVQESENRLVLIGKRFETHITPSVVEVYEAQTRILTVPRREAEGVLHILPEKSVRASRILRTVFTHEHLRIFFDVDHTSAQTRIILTHPVRKQDDPSVIRDYLERYARLLPGTRKGVWKGDSIPLHVNGKVNPRILRMLPREEQP